MQNSIAPNKAGLQARIQKKGWWFIAPAAILIVILVFYPMVQAFIYSLQQGKGEDMSFGGYESAGELFRNSETTGEAFEGLFSNYISMFSEDSKFKQALSNSFIYIIVQVPIMMVISIILASLLNNKKLSMRGLYRAAIFLPCAMSLVSCSMVFKQLFSDTGLINTVLIQTGLIDMPLKFLESNSTAKFVIILTMLWHWTGYNMVFYLAGLQNIDPGIYEAAKIEGANAIQRFTMITLPLLKPVIILTALLSANGTLQLFDEVMTLTNGNYQTLTLSKYIYDITVDSAPSFGYASAVSCVIFVLVAILALIQLKVGDSK